MRPRNNKVIKRDHTAAAPLLLVLLVMGSVAGCNVLKLPGPPPDLYNLTPKSTFSDDLPEIDKQLTIEEPLASGGLDNNRIALHPHSTRIKYFANARWSERAPKMLQTLLVESFENANKIVAVGRQSIGLRSDYTLKTELREFQVEHDAEAKIFTVRVRINAKLVQQPKRNIVGSHSFEHTVEITDDSGMDSIIIAFDQAAGRVLKKLVEWTLQKMNHA
ncbi:MAG: ABC-type transport auxiliary lipoprotein family protein [Desulfofustis sp.]|jgi:cholesterol transport system auxiliary component